MANTRSRGRGRVAGGIGYGAPRLPRGFSALPARSREKLGPDLMPPLKPAVNPRGTGMMNPSGEGPSRPAKNDTGRPSRGSKGGEGPTAGISNAGLPGPGGRQLEARVQSGAITQAQAQKTMQQRQTLAKALGPNWRDKLSVGGQSFAQVNKQLKANPGNAKLAALRKKLVANRSSVLEAARAKNKGAKGGEGQE